MHGIVINLDSRPERWQFFQEHNKFPFTVERFPAIKASSGEDGCTMSHLTVIKSQTEFPFLVCEDDCLMIQPWSMVETAMAQLPSDWDALWLGATLTRPLKKHSSNLYHLRYSYCLHAVIYNTPRMVNYVLDNHHTPLGKNLDIFYYRDVQNKFNCFITCPLCATQTEGYSDIAKKATGSWIIEESYNKFLHEVHGRKLQRTHR